MPAKYEEPEILSLKDKVFAEVLRWFAGGASCVVILLVVQAMREPALQAGVTGPALLIAPLAGFTLLHRAIGYPRTAVAFLGYLLLVICVLETMLGLTPGVALATISFLVLSGLFFGARGARRAFAATLASLLVAGLISTRTGREDWQTEWWDPTNPIVWLRYGAVLFFFGGAVLSAFTKLNQGLADSRSALRDTLERERAERRQRELAQEALEQARRLEALAQFAGGLAHDFNNNLMVIMGNTSLIADDQAADERVRNMAREIGKSAEAGAEMVRQLLTLGRAAPPAPQRVTVDAIVQQCRGTLRKVLPEGVQLNIEVSAHSELLVDVAAAQQALLNLALNARDALGENGMFTLRAEERMVSKVPAGFEAQAGRYVTLSCEDSGVGMDETTLTRVFEPFFTTKVAGKGTGLGLSMVRRFVCDAGGFITLASQPGEGTTFSLHLPVANERTRSDPSAPSEHAAESL